MSTFLKYTFFMFHFLLFAFVACNQPSTTATTSTPPKTTTETVTTQPNAEAQAATKEMLGNLADKKTEGATSSNSNVTQEDLNNPKSSEDDLQSVTNSNGTTTIKKRHRHHHRKMYDRSPTGVLPGEGPNPTDETQSDNQQVAVPDGSVKQIPAKVYTVLAYVLKNHIAPAGYVGGRVFTNVEKVLPVNNASGKKINYQEWDVNPHVNGVNRGTERLCTGDDKRYWYTNDHYQTFVEIK